MNTTTTNLAEFGARERSMLIELLQAWEQDGLPSDFKKQEVLPMMNTSSGNVFLTNEDCQAAMINTATSALESFYYTPDQGKEGFWDELAEQFDDMTGEDQEWFRMITETLGKELPETKEPNKG